MKRLYRRVGAMLVAAAVALSAYASLDTLPIKIIDGKKYYYYTVQPKETVYSLCKRFDITSGQLIEANPSVTDGLKAGQELLFPVDAPVKETIEYMVQRGETGYGIAHKFGMALEEFYALNPQAHDGLKVGQNVKVRRIAAGAPASQQAVEPEKSVETSPQTPLPQGSYEIQQGETLYQIARRNGVSIQEIVDANPGLDVDHYAAGQVIAIPSAGNDVAETIASRINFNPSGKEYQVVAGDTFFGIAHSHGISVDQLQAANPSVSVLETGQTIVIPDACPEPNVPAGPQPIVIPAADTINIALALPLKASAAKRDSKSQQMIEFYRGFVLAIDSMRNQGHPVRLSVFDTKGTDEGVKAVLADKELKKANIIVGPQTAQQMKQFGTFAKNNGCYLLNMFVVRDTEYLTNPYVLHNNIPHTALYQKAIDYFISTYPQTVPVFLARNGGSADKAEFVELFKKALKAAGRKYHDINYKQLSAATLSQLPEGIDYAFIPNSSKKDELDTFINALLKYKEDRTDGSVNLWGYSEWLILRGDNMKKLHDANTLLFSRFYSVVNDPSEESLEQTYKQWYGVSMADKVPCQGTFGFDTGMYILNAINSNDGDFSRPTPPYDGLQNAFDFIRVDGGGLVNNEMYIIRLAPGDYSSKLGI